MNPDFSISYHGTLALLHPHTDLCHAWINENVQTEASQWFGSGAAGGALAVEPRYLDHLVEGLHAAGFLQAPD
jgi:hypothetical protein